MLNKDDKLKGILGGGVSIFGQEGQVSWEHLIPKWFFFHPCGSGSCTFCKYAIKKKDFCGNDHKEVLTIKHFMNCNTLFAVCVIICTHCDLIYVGCTKRPLKIIIAEHITDITHNHTNVSGAARHFIDRHDASLQFFWFFCNWEGDKPKQGGNWVHKLHNREAFWISYGS